MFCCQNQTEHEPHLGELTWLAENMSEFYLYIILILVVCSTYDKVISTDILSDGEMISGTPAEFNLRPLKG
jgi:hypothetical protein